MYDQVIVRPAGIAVAHTDYVLRFRCKSGAGNQCTCENNQETLANSFSHDAPSVFSSVFWMPFFVQIFKRGMEELRQVRANRVPTMSIQTIYLWDGQYFQ
jgi:hypothetical protein